MESRRAVNLSFLSVNQQTPAKHLLSAWDCVRLRGQKSDKTYFVAFEDLTPLCPISH